MKFFLIKLSKIKIHFLFLRNDKKFENENERFI